MNKASVRKAVFPVAGLGTRFLPATKASPKEMLPVVDKPLIQYAVEEAVAAGITDLIFVTGRGKRAIEDHFDQAVELELALAQGKKSKLLAEVRSILPRGVNCMFVRQAQPLGLGHAVLCARSAVGNEPFAVLLADDLIAARNPVLAQMARVHHAQGSSVIAVERVSKAEISRYGVVAVSGRSRSPHVISGIVEKPPAAQAPSRLGVVGRYILTPAIFSELERSKAGRGGEIQLTDAIARLQRRETVLAYEFQGRRFDCGSKLGYLEANVELAKKHPEIGTAFRRYLRRTAR
ncbi:MAG: UTP--glucose-1-phosphate uridylyltransferase GalU [Betaproteobacteria bacterium]|nr:UTP--glucose-1-phosphate uridylyltransferase GalU [Betaproteobacteria bacterium]MDH5341905.1 UTP--glucose-1-phosphate uridylyltransferase GalU [Betaproteobacteria bacterium]